MDWDCIVIAAFKCTGFDVGLKTEPRCHSAGINSPAGAGLQISAILNIKNYFPVESGICGLDGAGCLSVMSTTSISNKRFWLGWMSGGFPCAP
jgi:hypothetical protein